METELIEFIINAYSLMLVRGFYIEKHIPVKNRIAKKGMLKPSKKVGKKNK